jgi:hypothetical protein
MNAILNPSHTQAVNSQNSGNSQALSHPTFHVIPRLSFNIRRQHQTCNLTNITIQPSRENRHESITTCIFNAKGAKSVTITRQPPILQDAASRNRQQQISGEQDEESRSAKASMVLPSM